MHNLIKVSILVLISCYCIFESEASPARQARCANLFDESCTNGGLSGSKDDEKWMGRNGLGKRQMQMATANQFETNTEQLLHRLRNILVKQCENFLDEACNAVRILDAKLFNLENKGNTKWDSAAKGYVKVDEFITDDNEN